MRILVLLGFVACGLVSCQTKNSSPTTVGEFGAPAFDEIVVHSTLTVRGKSSSRGAKALVSDTKTKTVPLLNTNITSTTAKAPLTVEADGASITLKRNKRVPRRYRPGAYQSFGGFPSSSSSSAQASSNSFNQNTPFGNFGASASQSSSQSQSFGHNGVHASAGHSGSQSYRFPNGNSIDVSFSNGFSSAGQRPTFSNSYSVTLTKPNGQKQQLAGK